MRSVPAMASTTSHLSESTRLSQAWQQLTAEAQAEIERRAKANGLPLIEQLRLSLPAMLDASVSMPEAPPEARAVPPTMRELMQALEELIALMKRPPGAP
ncbi:hypothetical protein NITMOv2_2430 [Nitrospira moscoviensis]|uniref:Uncharacterized protein n=2 Tax=Nitrospira moscoviensis TaxID=42253 RepID=A0A0K2GD18_NITMO|nr:hypothetical protein NITMOv2_2430 [Nitrospira moscoviensis]